jgi:hypothetical protein
MQSRMGLEDDPLRLTSKRLGERESMGWVEGRDSAWTG